MQSFALVALLGALFTTGVTAGPYKRDQLPTDVPSSVLFSFSDPPPSALPSGTGVPQAMPTGTQGSGGAIYICHPVDPSSGPGSYPGAPNNATLSAIPSGPVPTSTSSSDGSNPGAGAPPTPTDGASAPNDGQGSGGPVYICYPADSGAAPALNPDSTPASNAPTPSGTDVPNAIPSGTQPSGGPSYICSPADGAAGPAPSGATPQDATLTPVPSGPAPTSVPSGTPSDQ